MDDVGKKLRDFATLWLSSKSNTEIIHGFNGVDITTDQLIAAADRIEALEAQLAKRDAERVERLAFQHSMRASSWRA